jgi:hypothetical protein
MRREPSADQRELGLIPQDPRDAAREVRLVPDPGAGLRDVLSVDAEEHARGVPAGPLGQAAGSWREDVSRRWSDAELHRAEEDWWLAGIGLAPVAPAALGAAVAAAYGAFYFLRWVIRG